MASPPPEDLVELDTDVQASDQVTLSDEEQDEADQDESNQVAVGARGRGTGRSGKGGKGRGRGAGDAAPSEVGSTSSKKAVNKDLTGVKKQNKQYSRKCKGCGLYFKPEGMGSKSAFCLKDKHRLDALTRVAKAQGKLKWIKDVRKDEDKVSKVLKKYDELTGGTGALKSQGSKSQLFTSLDTSSATSRVQFGTECQMMPEDVYMKHVTEKLSEGEGRLTKAQANIQWQTWMDLIQTTPDTEEVIYDRKGANGSVRVAVPLRDTVLLANIFDRTKSFQAREKDQKDLSEESILQKKKQLLLDHDRNSDLDARAIGAGMVKAAGDGTAGNCFAGNAFEVDVEMLNPKTPEKEDQAADGEGAPEGQGAEKENQGQAPGDEDGRSGPAAPTKKRGYWDRDPAIASKMRAENNALMTLQMQVDNKLVEGRDQMKEASKRGPECERETAIERDTLTKRLEFLEAVMKSDSASLESLKNSCVASPKEATPVKSSEGSTEASTVWTEQIGKAPPSQSYLSLMTLPSIKDSAEAAWWKCQSAQELKDLNKERTNDRKPIQELVNAVKTGINELKKAIVAYDQRVSAKRSSTTSAAAGSKRKKQKTGVEPSFFDKALEQGSSMHFYSSLEEAKDKLDCNMPAIVRVADLVKPILAEDTVAGAAAGFAAAFANHVKSNDKANIAKPPERRTKARAASKIQGQAAVRLMDAFSGLFGDFLPSPVPEMNLEVCHIGVQAGSVTSASEKGWSASVRVSSTGTKTIALIPASKVHELAGDLNPTSFWDMVLHPEKTAFEGDLLKCLLTGTAGPFDLIWLPAGWIFAENIMEDSDLHGLCFRGFTAKNSAALSEVKLVQKLLTSHGRPDADVDRFLAALEKEVPVPAVPAPIADTAKKENVDFDSNEVADGFAGAGVAAEVSPEDLQHQSPSKDNEKVKQNELNLKKIGDDDDNLEKKNEVFKKDAVPGTGIPPAAIE